ncbi:MAG: nicotinate phosphoribosyltransferase [Candidatus Nomurabacteria bacterium]
MNYFRNSEVHEVADKIYNNLHSTNFVSPIQNLTDVDFYKFTMGQFIFRFYPEVEVKFKLIIRDKKISLVERIVSDEKFKDELFQSLDYISSLRFRKTDMFYLRGMDLYDKNMFKNDYLNFLGNLTLPKLSPKIGFNTFDLGIEGLWSENSHWETIAMATITELYYRSMMRDMSEQEVHDMYVISNNRLQNMLLEIKKNPSISFSDFGQRRRNSFLWQDYVVKECKRVLGGQFVGTSNTYLAFKHDLVPIGTNAHELPMVATALAVGDKAKRNAQYAILKQWQKVYGKGLRIILPDTFGSEQFFKNAPDWASNWIGQRQDSGDPIAEGERYKAWLSGKGINLLERKTIFSDGLDISPMKDITSHFHGNHQASFGWGTLLTNNFADTVPGNENFRPFSMVVKVSEARSNIGSEWNPCVKLSNNIEKATGTPSAIKDYIRIFGDSGRVDQQVVV